MFSKLGGAQVVHEHPGARYDRLYAILPCWEFVSTADRVTDSMATGGIMTITYTGLIISRK
jgi:hypothetical protein